MPPKPTKEKQKLLQQLTSDPKEIIDNHNQMIMHKAMSLKTNLWNSVQNLKKDLPNLFATYFNSRYKDLASFKSIEKIISISKNVPDQQGVIHLIYRVLNQQTQIKHLKHLKHKIERIIICKLDYDQESQNIQNCINDLKKDNAASNVIDSYEQSKKELDNEILDCINEYRLLQKKQKEAEDFFQEYTLLDSAKNINDVILSNGALVKYQIFKFVAAYYVLQSQNYEEYNVYHKNMADKFLENIDNLMHNLQAWQKSQVYLTLAVYSNDLNQKLKYSELALQHNSSNKKAQEIQSFLKNMQDEAEQNQIPKKKESLEEEKKQDEYETENYNKTHSKNEGDMDKLHIEDREEYNLYSPKECHAYFQKLKFQHFDEISVKDNDNIWSFKHSKHANTEYNINMDNFFAKKHITNIYNKKTTYTAPIKHVVGNIYATIDWQRLNLLPNTIKNQFDQALDKGYLYRKEGYSGIKSFRINKKIVYELKINGDDRLWAEYIYSKEDKEEDTVEKLIIFDQHITHKDSYLYTEEILLSGENMNTE